MLHVSFKGSRFDEVIVAHSLPEARHELICMKLCDAFNAGLIESNADLIKRFEEISFMVRAARKEARIIVDEAANDAEIPELPKKPFNFRDIFLAWM